MQFDDIDLSNVLDFSRTDFSSEVAHAQHEFKMIHFKNPRLIEAVQQMEIMRKELRIARSLIANRTTAEDRYTQSIPQLLLPYIAPSGSGKTRNVQAYISHVYKTECIPDGDKPVVYVELRPSTTVKSMLSAVLEGLGDEFSEEGSVSELWRRLNHFIPRKRSELIIIDEAHNLFNSDSGILSKSTVNTLKGMANQGKCSFMLCAVEKAMAIIRMDGELVSRQRAPLLMKSLDINDPYDRQMYYGHLAALDVAMMNHGITESPSGLISNRIANCLYQATTFYWRLDHAVYTGSVIGNISKIVSVAIFYMLQRKSRQRSFVRIISEEDLCSAVDAWAMALGVCSRNPFRDAA